MKSLVISTKVYSCDIFMSFSSHLFIAGRMVQAALDGDRFIWYLQPHGYYQMDNCPIDKSQKVEKYVMMRDNPLFRSSESTDMIVFLIEEFEKFKQSVEMAIAPQPIYDNMPSGPVLGQVYYPATETPRKESNKDESSISVLIDLTSEKKYYCVGWYNYEQNCWVSPDEDSQKMIQNTEYKMLWRYID